jgi:carboxyl-terminal processing protease
VTEFILGKESIGKIDDFHFTDWAGFLSFLEKRNFNYDTDSEKLLEKLKAQSKDDGYVFESDILTLENKIIEAKKADLEKNKDAIINMIEKEIIGRYYYQKGKIQIGLRNDKEIKEAVKILNDKEKYASLLK